MLIFNKKKKKEETPEEIARRKRKEKRKRIIGMIFYPIVLLLLILWSHALWLAIFYVVLFDYYITQKVNWRFWHKRGTKKTALIDWIDAVVFAMIAAMLIRALLIEAYTIPTSSMEKNMLVGDYLFVSKYHYGPRLPITPLSVPFVHHTLPGTHHTPAFVDWIQMPYKRLAGLTEIKNDDIVVFNFPVGDTVLANMQAVSYYQLCRQYGREMLLNDEFVAPNGLRQKGVFGKLLIRPFDKKDNYVKRCVAIAGDSLEIIDGQIFINGKPQHEIKDMQYKYAIVTDGTPINPKIYERMNISQEDIRASLKIDPNIIVYMPELNQYDLANLIVLPMSSSMVEKFKTLPNVKFIKRIVKPKNYKDTHVFPHTACDLVINDTLRNYVRTIDDSLANLLTETKHFKSNKEFVNYFFSLKLDSAMVKNLVTYMQIAQEDEFAWNGDNFGPFWIPKAGESIDLTLENLPLYRRAIEVYEHNELKIENGKIFINGNETNSYTFKQGYYFMVGDNRHNSADSRFWGLVPEDHIVGTPLFIWLSLDKDKKFLSKIRHNRFLKDVKNL